MPGIPVSLQLTIAIAVFACLCLLWLLLHLRATVTRIETARPDQPRARQCPDCDKAMTAGYCVAGRGLVWRAADDPPLRLLLPLWRVLPNTLSVGMRLLENRAWHCAECQLILLDHGSMIDRKQTRSSS